MLLNRYYIQNDYIVLYLKKTTTLFFHTLLAWCPLCPENVYNGLWRIILHLFYNCTGPFNIDGFHRIDRFPMYVFGTSLRTNFKYKTTIARISPRLLSDNSNVWIVQSIDEVTRCCTSRRITCENPSTCCLKYAVRDATGLSPLTLLLGDNERSVEKRVSRHGRSSGSKRDRCRRNEGVRADETDLYWF